MSGTSTDEQTVAPEPAGEQTKPGEPWYHSRGVRLLGTFAAPVAAVLVLWVAFNYLRRPNHNRLLVASIAILVGVGGVFLLFWAMNRFVDWLPEHFREGVRPYIFVGPALVMLSVFLIYPVLNTILISFKDAHGKKFAGLDNYRFVFTDPSMLNSIRNTIGWILLVPIVAVAIGLVFATLADRLRRGEAVAKSLIFLPMAISFVGAAVVWRFMYSFRPQGYGSNIGLMNGIVQGVGHNPIPWLQKKPWNNLLLMVIMVWMQTGFAMVVLSAGIKAIPEEIIEAARIDGASEFQVFWRITVPSILPTIVVVSTYMVINALKVFDIVFVMGNAEANGTEVMAERMVSWFFIRDDDGKGAAIAVVLFLAVVPVMIWNIRRFRDLEEIR